MLESNGGDLEIVRADYHAAFLKLAADLNATVCH